MQIDETIKNILCQIFGEKYRHVISDETSMVDIEEWDSVSYFDVVFELEDAFGIKFTDAEITQLFEVGHIKRIVSAAQLNLPHEDVSNAICSLDSINNNKRSNCDIVVISASSTREGLLRNSEMLELLHGKTDTNHRWFNLSVSGLVLAETLQLVDQIDAESFKGVLAIGTSPIIWAGCGVAEFERSASFARFPFASPIMSASLSEFGYRPSGFNVTGLVSVAQWVERYLQGRNIEQLIYEPYLYPTLPPWSEDKYEDEASISLFYNNSLYNFRQSIEINSTLFEKLDVLCCKKNIPLVFVELTLHSKMKSYLEDLGNICSKYDTFISSFLKSSGRPYIDAVSAAKINDHEFRDPAHIYKGRDRYSQAVLQGLLDYLDCYQEVQDGV